MFLKEKQAQEKEQELAFPNFPVTEFPQAVRETRSPLPSTLGDGAESSSLPFPERSFSNDSSSHDAVAEPEVTGDTAGHWLADEIRRLMDDLDVPFGLATFGYTLNDVPNLVQGTMPQHRVTKLSPRPVGQPELEALFTKALSDTK